MECISVVFCVLAVSTAISAGTYFPKVSVWVVGLRRRTCVGQMTGSSGLGLGQARPIFFR